MAKQRMKLSDQIRQAVTTCGQTRYAISKATSISEATLSRFMSGERGLPMTTLDTLADYLNLNIKAPKPKGSNLWQASPTIPTDESASSS
jgi:transcriptional regulator with XRE-family HTH domain